MKTLLLGLLFASTATLFGQDLSGAYTGTAKLEKPDGSVWESVFTIVLKQDGGKLLVSAAPADEEQKPADKVERDGNSISFDISPPGDSSEPVKFAVTVKEGKMTGKLTAKRGNTVLSGTLELAKN